ncbi:MAG: hypothetical protein SCJ97_10790 [Bacillota bacterium]|nr:hypothetical protein [Bacillota bacterium]
MTSNSKLLVFAKAPLSLGGECSWTGCIPSKTLLAAAELAHKIQQSPWLESDFSKESKNLLEHGVMEHVRSTVVSAAKVSKAAALLKRYSVEVIIGSLSFVNNNTINLDQGDFNLKAAGVHYNTKGTTVNDYM